MKKKPFFSIVIALAPWREPEILDSLEKQVYPKENYEIIVIKGYNVPDNRNAGVKKSKGEIVLFLDDDAVIESDYLKNLDAFIRAHPDVDILGGPQLTPKDDGFFARVSGLALEDPFASPGVNKRYRVSKTTLNANSSYLTGANFAVRKNVFKKMTFDRDIYPADDVAFVDSAKKTGFHVAYYSEMKVYHRRRGSLKKLATQMFHYGRARPQKGNASDMFAKPVFLVPAVFLLYLLFLPTLLYFSVFFITPLVLYVLLSLIFSFYEAVRSKIFLAFFILPFIFLLTHISYGSGYLIGALDREAKYNEKG